jgi:cytochrome c oxidase cbb3-type subunit 3
MRALCCSLVAVVAFGAALLAQAAGPPPGTQGPPARFGIVAYPQRPPGDPAAIERGKALYGVNCTFCHGADARGGDGGGPNLLRSQAVLDDQRGELMAPTIVNGRGNMPALKLTTEQIADIAEFLHGFPVSSESEPSTVDILVGDARRGEAYVAAKCSSCHTTAALSTFAGRLADPKVLQQMWLMPGSGGRGSIAPIPAPPMTAVVTLPSGERIEGRLERLDDFTLSLVDGDGRRRTIRTFGTDAKVEIRDPLQPHRDLLPLYTDADIHNVTAYLASLRPRP